MSIFPVNEAAMADANAIRDQAEADYERIRSDGTLNVETIRARMAKVYVEAEQKMALARGTAGDENATQRLRILQAAFGIDDLVSPAGGNRAEVSISYRDAQDRADALTSAQDGSRLLARAVEQGDEVLARAIARHAYDCVTGLDSSWGPVLDEYVSTHPQRATAIANLQQLTQPRTTSARDLFAWALAKPAELMAFDDWQLAALAESA